MVDLKQVAEMGVPDSEGNVLPLSATEGSVLLLASSGKVIDPINIVMAGGTYNPQTATCGQICQTCQGCGYYSVSPIPLNGLISSYAQMYSACPWAGGQDIDLTASSNWSSNNLSVFTIQSSSDSNPGLTYGTGAGSDLAFAQTVDQLAVQLGQVCGSPSPPPCTYASQSNQGTVNVNSLSCSPSSVVRGSTITCSLNGPGTASNWSFSSSSSQTQVTSPNGSTATTWSGTMVDSGTISATANNGGNTTTVTTSVTVTARNWAFSPYSATQVTNGDPKIGVTLPQPPQPSGSDSGLGKFSVSTADNGLSAVTTVSSGPNQGYSYFSTNVDYSSGYYVYEINPDLSNQNSSFSQAQYGMCGYISWANLSAQTVRHESGANASHYTEYTSALNSNNPGTYLEQQIAAPNADINQFGQVVRNQLTSIYNAIGSAAGAENIPPVNYDASNNFLGNINYADANGQYGTCP